MIRQSFNDCWAIVKAGGFFDQLRGGEVSSLPVQLPHDAMIHETPDPDDVSGGQTGFYPGGQYVYVKTFTPPAEWAGRDVYIEFEGGYMTAMVYINGCHAATNLYGYGGFLVKADSLLRWGAPNEIKVIANNPTPNSRWYSGSGIYRNVNLMVGGDVHILPSGVRATTKLATAGEAILDIETRLVNITRDRQRIQLKATLSRDGAAVGQDTLRVGLFSQDEETLFQSLHIDNPRLWSPDAPNLYDLTVEVLRDDAVLDRFTTRVGLRTLTLDVAHGLRINGVSVKQRGACIHHDNGVIGAATFAAAEKRRAIQLKAAGFNAVRSAHHPMSPEMLDACDEVGLMVMDELSDVWYEQKNTNDFSNFFDLCWEEQIARRATSG
jgi:beta-galactosidase/beta-glucuronidase